VNFQYNCKSSLAVDYALCGVLRKEYVMLTSCAMTMKNLLVSFWLQAIEITTAKKVAKSGHMDTAFQYCVCYNEPVLVAFGVNVSIQGSNVYSGEMRGPCRLHRTLVLPRGAGLRDGRVNSHKSYPTHRQTRKHNHISRWMGLH
jgi:hypothetical protein